MKGGTGWTMISYDWMNMEREFEINRLPCLFFGCCIINEKKLNIVES